MTIGIAARGPGFIVTVTDRRQSLRDLTGIDDGIAKSFRIERNWGFLFAGLDVNLIYDLGTKAINYAYAKPGARTSSEIKECISLAYAKVREDQVISKILRPLNYENLYEFREKAAREFGPEITAEILKNIMEFDLGAELLVYGFDRQNEAKLFRVDNPGFITPHETPWYWAVGSGFDFAITVLNTKLSRRTSPDEATLIFHLCEAKFAAEWDSGVGKTTTVAVWYPDGHFRYLLDSEIDEIRNITEGIRHQPIPEKARELIVKATENNKGRADP